ncbi:hypothetical protein NQ314_019339 [Rhamnusium bicolor]|uniref:hydroxyisourate hydrolase n=1 Tax=Rhamnusium bicolor TaxID=1586634 RepID=A0AAV8WP52_9CUCU|nr:hypothetical protein NQ314_019339 [Rhamnusium bicolor]
MKSEEIEQVDEDSHDSTEINVIPVQLMESYEGVSFPTPSSSSNISRGKYYKQTYRPAWEQMPDFKVLALEMESEEIEQVDEDSHDSTEINVIPVQLVESYEGVTLPSPSNSSNISRGKYYKQTYRPAWEQMPDFKVFLNVGWLRGVEGEPTRAYCTYCQKTLHAHRLSLLKHTCTIRHQKAAQLHNNRKNKVHVNQSNQIMESQEVQTVIINEGAITQDDIDEDGETQTVEYVEAAEMEDGDTEHDNDDEEDGEQPQLEFHRVQFQKHFEQQQQAQVADKSPISTHVIDTTRGQPVTGLQVSLYKLIDGRWTYINEGVTNSNGRFAQFLERNDFTPGRYKLHYDVDRYFEARKQNTLYPFIEIVFDSTLYTETYHIPMLLSPFGYTTYRGS